METLAPKRKLPNALSMEMLAPKWELPIANAKYIDFKMVLASDLTAALMLNMVVGRGMLLILIGEAIGIGVTALLSPVFNRFLYGVSRVDPLITTAVLVGLAIAAFAACSLPAFKAGNMDPYQILRK